MRHLWILALVACRGAPVPPRHNPAPPVDVSDELGPPERRQTRAFAVADLDGDHRLELVVERAQAIEPLTGGASWPGRLLGACDVDGDGRDEIVASVDGDLFIGVHRALGGAATLALCLDADGDGRKDVLASGRRLALWSLEGASLVDRAEERGLIAPAPPVVLVAAPMPGTPPDIVALVDDGPNLYFARQADGKYRQFGKTVGIDDLEEKQRAGAAALDLDGDGAIDLAIANRGRGRFYVRRGGGFLDVAAPPWAKESPGGPIVAADLDGDGALEIYAAPGRLFTVEQGLTVPIEAGSLATPEHVVAAAAADLGGDGRMEVIVLAGGQLSLHRARRP